MRRKRLQHVADTLCHMFCGWQTFFDYNELVKLGNGKLEIDVLSGECVFNESFIDSLSIAKALQNWLKEDCEKNKIDMNQLVKGQKDRLVVFIDRRDEPGLPACSPEVIDAEISKVKDLAVAYGKINMVFLMRAFVYWVVRIHNERRTQTSFRTGKGPFTEVG